MLFALLLFYLILPNFSFPKPPSDSFQSSEPGDSEDLIHRRAYFTNYSREEILSYYQKQLKNSYILGIKIPNFRLNYPPEEAQTIIRDQTRSTFLEEIVVPFRESFFVNGFEPTSPKDDIRYQGVHYRQKITVKYISSNVLIRLSVFSLVIILFWFIYKEILYFVKDLYKLKHA